MSSDVSATQGFVTTDDGVELFWRKLGHGEPAIVCCNGIGVGVSFWDYLVERFDRTHAIVLWDYRGHGRSTPQRAGMVVDIPRLAKDLGIVCQAAGVERAVFAGHSMGSQVILERYRQAPEQIVGLVSVLGTFGHPLDTFQDMAGSRQIFDLILQVARTWPRALDWFGSMVVAAPYAFDAGRLLKLVDGDRLSRHDLRPYLHHLAGGISFGFFFLMAESMGEHSARDLLHSIEAPVLVIAGEFDGFTPPRLARELHDSLPNSTMVMLEGASHAGLIEQPGRMNDALETFLTALERVTPARAGSSRPPARGRSASGSAGARSVSAKG
jgi:pimeloyl-ACP methyl ester carboxylesterase